MSNEMKCVEFIQYMWKKAFNEDKSKSQIRRDLEQGAIKLNDRKLKVDDIIIINKSDENYNRGE